MINKAKKSLEKLGNEKIVVKGNWKGTIGQNPQYDHLTTIKEHFKNEFATLLQVLDLLEEINNSSTMQWLIKCKELEKYLDEALKNNEQLEKNVKKTENVHNNLTENILQVMKDIKGLKRELPKEDPATFLVNEGWNNALCTIGLKLAFIMTSNIIDKHLEEKENEKNQSNRT